MIPILQKLFKKKEDSIPKTIKFCGRVEVLIIQL